MLYEQGICRPLSARLHARHGNSITGGPVFRGGRWEPEAVVRDANLCPMDEPCEPRRYEAGPPKTFGRFWNKYERGGLKEAREADEYDKLCCVQFSVEG